MRVLGYFKGGVTFDEDASEVGGSWCPVRSWGGVAFNNAKRRNVVCFAMRSHESFDS